MPAVTRRPHRKSRHGCQQCKQNRTKCDERRPTCTRCVRVGAECSLLDPSSALIIIDSSYEKQQRDTSDTGYPSPSASPKTLSATESSPKHNVSSTSTTPTTTRLTFSDTELDRLRLINHYNQSTWKTVSELTMDSQQGQLIWHKAIPELAFKHDYLLHGVLSVTALHIALEDPSNERYYGTLAVQHHNEGIQLFGAHLQSITKENIDALFAFACLTALYSFGVHLTSRLQLSPLVKIHEAFTMIRGSGVIVGGGIEWLRSGIWSSWFDWCDENDSEPLPIEIREALDKLTQRIGTTVSTSTQREMYESAILYLRKNLWWALYRPQTQMALVMLPICGPPELTQMVCMGEPLALAILANWAVILHWLRRLVWIADWGQQTILAINDILPTDWRDCISWAMKELESSQQQD